MKRGSKRRWWCTACVSCEGGRRGVLFRVHPHLHGWKRRILLIIVWCGAGGGGGTARSRRSSSKCHSGAGRRKFRDRECGMLNSESPLFVVGYISSKSLHVLVLFLFGVFSFFFCRYSSHTHHTGFFCGFRTFLSLLLSLRWIPTRKGCANRWVPIPRKEHIVLLITRRIINRGGEIGPESVHWRSPILRGGDRGGRRKISTNSTRNRSVRNCIVKKGGTLGRRFVLLPLVLPRLLLIYWMYVLCICFRRDSCAPFWRSTSLVPIAPSTASSRRSDRRGWLSLVG